MEYEEKQKFYHDVKIAMDKENEKNLSEIIPLLT